MLTIDVPEGPRLELAHLVSDLNGTLALDGLPLRGVAERLRELGRRLDVRVLTADTNNTAARLAAELGVRLERLSPGRGDEQKLAYVKRLGARTCCALGNGRNDVLMLREAALGITVIGREGAAREAIEAADIVCYEPVGALELLLNPNRLVATLRR